MPQVGQLERELDRKDLFFEYANKYEAAHLVDGEVLAKQQVPILKRLPCSLFLSEFRSSGEKTEVYCNTTTHSAKHCNSFIYMNFE